MKLKSTGDCKAYIQNKIESSDHLKTECSYHEITNFNSSQWTRLEKRKVNAQDDFTWIFESKLYPDEVWLKPGIKSVFGMTLRRFSHKAEDADCLYVDIITDDADDLIAFTFSID